MNEWQPIETAPKDGTPIIVFDPTKHPTSEQIPGTLSYRTNFNVTYVRKPFVAYWWQGNELNRPGWFEGLYCFPTHWMHLPDPPRPLCDGCGYEMDPDWCHCGDAIKDHKGMSHNHSPVPMGCQCGREKPDEMSEV